MSDDLLVDPYVRVLFGANAVHTACNYVVQPSEGNKASLIGTTSFAKQMSFGGSDKYPHVLVLCDVVIRPRLVIGSHHLAGAGVSGILRDGLSEDGVADWVRDGETIFITR